VYTLADAIGFDLETVHELFSEFLHILTLTGGRSER
jgi:hypothetical protein